MKKRIKKLPTRQMYPVALTICDAKQLEAKQKAVQFANSSGLWPLLFTLTHERCDWTYVLKTLENQSRK